MHLPAARQHGKRFHCVCLGARHAEDRDAVHSVSGGWLYYILH